MVIFYLTGLSHVSPLSKFGRRLKAEVNRRVAEIICFSTGRNTYIRGVRWWGPGRPRRRPGWGRNAPAHGTRISSLRPFLSKWSKIVGCERRAKMRRATSERSELTGDGGFSSRCSPRQTHHSRHSDDDRGDDANSIICNILSKAPTLLGFLKHKNRISFLFAHMIFCLILLS